MHRVVSYEPSIKIPNIQWKQHAKMYIFDRQPFMTILYTNAFVNDTRSVRF
jgi:hypothetical protein